MPDAEREWTLDGRVKRGAAPAVRQCGQCFAVFAPAPKCPSCGYVIPVAASARTINQRSGVLEEITSAEPVKPKAADIKVALRGARSLAEFQAVARDFGYKSGWAFQMHTIYSRNRRKVA